MRINEEAINEYKSNKIEYYTQNEINYIKYEENKKQMQRQIEYKIKLEKEEKEKRQKEEENQKMLNDIIFYITPHDTPLNALDKILNFDDDGDLYEEIEPSDYEDLINNFY
jgi:hypothetical protein